MRNISMRLALSSNASIYKALPASVILAATSPLSEVRGSAVTQTAEGTHRNTQTRASALSHGSSQNLKWRDGMHCEDNATDALPAAGEWALEIILDGHLVGDMTAERLGNLAQSYADTALDIQELIVDDVKRCAAQFEEFKRANKQYLTKYRSCNLDTGQSSFEPEGQDRADADERMDVEQLQLMLKASLETAEQENTMRQQRRQKEQDDEEDYMQEQMAKIVQVEEEERLVREREKRHADRLEEEKLHRVLEASMGETHAEETLPVEVSAPCVRNGENLPEGVPPPYDELNHVG